MSEQTPTYSYLARNRWLFSGWFLVFAVLVLLICLPIGALLLGLDPLQLGAVPAAFFSDYALNSYLLLFLTGFLSLIFALPAAWLTATREFPGRKVLEWLLVLPLALPAYIAAYTYKGIFDPFGTTRKWFGFYAEIDNLPVLALIMASVLYPYVYLVSRSAFQKQSSDLEEAARTFGYTQSQIFFKLVLPLSRPAIFGGLSLVAMEVLNNYGAVKYFGITTFTTEILRLWNPLDLQPVIRISLVLLVVVFVLFQAERWQQRKARFYSKGSAKPFSNRHQLSGSNVVLALIACIVPLLIGFIIPVLQLIVWAVPLVTEVINLAFLQLAGYSFLLAILAGLACLVVAVLIGYANRLIPHAAIRFLTRLSTLGYAVPGAVIGIGVLVPVALASKHLNWVLTGSIGILVYAYVVRFQAVAYQAIDNGFKKHSPNLLAAARALGSNPLTALFRVELPLLRPALLASAILVFVDVTKELPLTMLFQRFNYETLAVRAFTLMETDGAVYDSSVPALLIVAIGLIPVILLHRLLNNSDRGRT